MKIKHVDGRETYLEPTQSDASRMEKDREKIKVNAQGGRLTRAAIEKKDREAARLPSDMQNRQFAVDGLRRHAKRLDRQNDARGAILATMADQAAGLLQDYTLATIEISEPRADILRDAAQPIAAKLAKTIGGFADDAEAVNFVLRTWPLTAARAEAANQANAFGRMAKRRTKLGQDFWATIEGAAAKAGLGDDAVRQLQKLGAM